MAVAARMSCAVVRTPLPRTPIYNAVPMNPIAQLLATAYAAQQAEIAPFYALIVILMIKPYGLFGTKDIERV